jgi:hypothetical protein
LAALTLYEVERRAINCTTHQYVPTNAEGESSLGKGVG